MKLQDIQTKTRGRQQPTHHPVILYSIVFLFNEINKAFEYLESVKSLCRILVQLSIGRELLVSMSGERERGQRTRGTAWPGLLTAHWDLGAATVPTISHLKTLIGTGGRGNRGQIFRKII